MIPSLLMRDNKNTSFGRIWDEIYFTSKEKEKAVELTIQQVHSYYDLVKNGEAEELIFAGIDYTPGGSLIIPKLDDNDQVYFYDMLSKTKIYPGLETIKKIHISLAKIKKP